MHMKRREFITFLAGATVCNSNAWGQGTQRVRRIGVLQTLGPDSAEYKRRLSALKEGLQDLGWLEGRNIIFELRSAVGQMERLPGLAAELVAANVDVIVTAGVELIQAARNASASIPIVMPSVGDAVGAGLIASLAHPGGNITGLTLVASEQSTKRFEFMKAIVPDLERVGIIWNAANVSHRLQFEQLEPAAQVLKVTFDSLPARDTADIEKALKATFKKGSQAIFTMDDGLIQSNASRIVELATRERIPVVGEFRNLAEAGAILSYSPNILLMWRHSATFIDKIFKGEKAGDLPVEQPTTFLFVLNLKTAKTLGLAVPPTLLALADEVIE
jgi:putative ABC transport system substrate-binding protein